MSLLPVGFGASGDEYGITDSLRLRSSASAYLSRTFASAGNRKTWTFSFWSKTGTLTTYRRVFSTVAGGSQFYFRLDNNDQFTIESAGTVLLNSTSVYRDPSAWYHFLIVLDTTQSTASNRLKVYINGTQVTAFDTTNYPSQNSDHQWNNNVAHYISGHGSGEYYDGYVTEANFIDGQALTADDFGEYDDNGTWKPLAYEGTYGTNGFYLNGVGVTDQSGNGNNWTNNNLNLSTSTATTYDQMKDTPSLVDTNAGNFCTLNPLDKYSSAVIAEGNLKIGANNNSWTNQARSTFFVSSGKWYWEVTFSPGTGSFWKAGIRDAAAALTSNTTSSTGYEYYAYNGNKQATGVNSSYGSGLTAGDVLAFALDMDAGTITAYKNNTSLGVMFSGLSGSYSPTVSMYNSFISFNFGQRPFAYTPPTGFLKLNTFNLPDSTIEDGSQHFEAITRNGFGSSGGTVATNFQADLIWEKPRNAAYSHYIIDNVRGIANGTAPFLSSNTSSAEQNANWYLPPTSSTIGFNSSDWSTSTTLVDWIWKASNTTATNSAGTNGATLASTYSANPTAGFSIVTYTGNQVAGSTVYHGLGTAPYVIIVKGRNNSTSGWAVGHQSLGWGSWLSLHTINAVASGADLWNNTAPSANLLTLGISGVANLNNQTAVAYCFAPIEGYSAFGKYTGNGSADGPFVYTGFRPAWVLFKRSDNSFGADWIILDTARDTYNSMLNRLNPNGANAENATLANLVDYTSNGFKIRSTLAGMNTNGGTFIYMAFAENPFKNALAR